MSIVTQAQFESFLAVTGSTMSAAGIAVTTEYAELRLNSICKRTFALHWENSTFEVQPWQTRRYRLRSKDYPIVAGTVMLTNNTTGYAEADLVVDYSTGIIYVRKDEVFFDTGRDALQLMCQCGWAEGEAPYDFQYLVFKIAYSVQSQPTTLFKSEDAGDYSYVLSNDMLIRGLDPIAQSVVSKYVKVM